MAVSPDDHPPRGGLDVRGHPSRFLICATYGAGAEGRRRLLLRVFPGRRTSSHPTPPHIAPHGAYSQRVASRSAKSTGRHMRIARRETCPPRILTKMPLAQRDPDIIGHYTSAPRKTQRGTTLARARPFTTHRNYALDFLRLRSFSFDERTARRERPPTC